MRVPLSLSILLAIAVPLVVWWLGVRDMDFLTPPTEAQLTAVRQHAADALPPTQIPNPSPAPPEAPPTPPAMPNPSPEKKPVPAVEIGDLNPNPGLNTYAELAPKGARHLIELASLLETAGELPRTLLAWERVLDATAADPSQASAASAAIQRLRSALPAPKRNPGKAIQIIIHANTGGKLEASLKTHLEQAAHSLELASCGILIVTTKVTINRKSTSKSTQSTVAIWLSGSAEKSPTTETLSFTVAKSEVPLTELLRKLFLLTGNRLQTLGFPQLIPIAADETPLHALESHVTRRHWDKFGRSLNPPPTHP
ncbi:MAG: hypothetical protein WCP35_16390 [Verrucomicrobiota bacterium]